jgi:hypothetical protein
MDQFKGECPEFMLASRNARAGLDSGRTKKMMQREMKFTSL